MLEDPATGAAAAALAGMLRDEGNLSSGDLTILQGVDMGRPSRITVRLDDVKGSPVFVSGGAVEINCIGNPKAILILTPFFPQFVVPGDYWGSFLILGAILLVLELLAIALYAYAGTRISGVMRNAHGPRWINRISGSTMIAFGALLAAARRPTA